MFDYLFFDLDGTLTDSLPGIKNSFIYAFNELNENVPEDSVLSTFIGPPLYDTFEKLCGFSKEKAEKAVKKYREYYEKTGMFENSVYKGIPSLLEELKDSGKHLFVATSKPEIFSVKILEKFKLSQYFEKICGSNFDESRSNKEEVIKYALNSGFPIIREKALMIGDRKHDIFGAKKNNLKSCGVLYGYGRKEELESSGADYIVKTPEEIIKLVM